MQGPIETSQLSVKSGDYTFRSGNRLTAAKLAFKLSLAEQEALGKHSLSYLSAGKRALKSFFTRSVRIPEIEPEARLKRMADVHLLMQSCQDKKICSRQISLYETPEDWSWSHGKAKQLARHVVVRHWTTPGHSKASQHSALSMEDKIKGSNLYATWGGTIKKQTNAEYKYIPSLIRPIFRKVSEYFGKYTPKLVHSYSEDKQLQISQKVNERLRDSAYANKMMKNPNYTPDARMLEKASYKPLSFQKETNAKKVWSHRPNWQRRAEKIYLPSIGNNQKKDSSEPVFVMFGMNMKDMEKSWQDNKSSDSLRHYYRKFSTTQNCSGVSFDLLRVGGGDLYIPTSRRLYITPKNLDDYSRKLMQRVDILNDKADALYQRFEDSKASLTPYNRELALEAFSDSLKRSLPGSSKKSLQAIRKATAAFTGTETRLDEIIPKAIKLVEAMDKAYQMAGENPEAQQVLSPSLSVFMMVRGLIARASSDIPPPYSPPTTGNSLFSHDNRLQD